MPKKIVDAYLNPDGTTRAVLLSGNSTPTPAATAVRMAERGQIEGAHAVHPKDGTPFLRTNPGGPAGNNLDELGAQ